MIGEKVINERNGILGNCCEKYFKRILGGEIFEMEKIFIEFCRI